MDEGYNITKAHTHTQKDEGGEKRERREKNSNNRCVWLEKNSSGAKKL